MYSVTDILSILAPLGAKAIGHIDGDEPIRWLLTDSRSLKFPQETLFFALRTAVGDGHRYLPQLQRRGVRHFVVSTAPAQPEEDALYILVPDTLQALQALARHHREQHSCPVVAITGSNGKTTVKEWLSELLSPSFRVTRSPRSYNSQVGVPLSVWELTPDTQIAIIEAAISRPGEMSALERIIQPTVGLITNIGDAHQENFTSLEEKCMEKLKLFQNAEVLVYPQGDAVISQCVSRFPFHGRLVPVDTRQTATPLESNLLLCQALARHFGLGEDVIRERSRDLQPVAMRLEVKEGNNDTTVINDAYNSDLASLDIALDFMQRRPESEGRSMTLVLSDIDETGFPADDLYAHVAQLVRSRGVERLFAVGPTITAHASLFAGSDIETHFFPTTEVLLHSPLFKGLAHSIVLVKGARRFHFEALVEALSLRLHETILEVDLTALTANLRHYRELMAPNVRVVCMVKADAYGAGAIEVARTLQDQGVDYLAVAVADEGVALRRAGITCGIMVMNPEMGGLSPLFRYHLEPEVYSFRILHALVEAAREQGVTNHPVHVKLDTGMHRLGFHPQHDMARLIDELTHQTALMPASVFSHFAGSDDAVFDDFTHEQVSLFHEASDRLQTAYPHHRILRHICNSAAIGRFPEFQHDMVRLGLGLYGIDPFTGQIINNVSTLRTHILQIRDVSPQDTVGYSRRGRLERPSRIAAIPIGYADGLNRHLGNRHGHCLVHGKPAPYVGNICMDVALIDVTDIPECQEGDSAVIFGPELPVTQLAQWLDTIPYEVLTSVSPRVKRVYLW